jgi:hypothetical protein
MDSSLRSPKGLLDPERSRGRSENTQGWVSGIQTSRDPVWNRGEYSNLDDDIQVELIGNCSVQPIGAGRCEGSKRPISTVSGRIGAAGR